MLALSRRLRAALHSRPPALNALPPAATPPRPPAAPEQPNRLAWLRSTMPTTFGTAEAAALRSRGFPMPAETARALEARGVPTDPSGAPPTPTSSETAPNRPPAQSALEARHGASDLPRVLSTPFLAFRGPGKPLDTVALVVACRAMLVAHDTGHCRTPAIEAIRSTLTGFGDGAT